MSASALIGIIALILSLGTVILVALLSFRNAEKAYLTLNRIHARQSEQLDKTLDRLMTIRWEDYVATQTLDSGEEGGFFPPVGESEDESEDEVGSWGALRGLRRPGALDQPSAEEQELLDEDFPDEAEG